MIIELGHLLAFLALGAAAAQSVLGLTSGGEAARRLAVAGAMFAALSLLTLIISFVRLDFSVELVAAHSHSQKPLLYRIAGAWGNHEGSMLLWVFILAGWSAAVAVFSASLARDMRARVLSVMGMISVG